jgi:hypothetical protein
MGAISHQRGRLARPHGEAPPEGPRARLHAPCLHQYHLPALDGGLGLRCLLRLPARLQDKIGGLACLVRSRDEQLGVVRSPPPPRLTPPPAAPDGSGESVSRSREAYLVNAALILSFRGRSRPAVKSTSDSASMKPAVKIGCHSIFQKHAKVHNQAVNRCIRTLVLVENTRLSARLAISPAGAVLKTPAPEPRHRPPVGPARQP